MLNYLNAELFRTKKSLEYKIMMGLGIGAILFGFIIQAFYSDNPTRDDWFFNMSTIMQSSTIFISILITGASLKKDHEERGLIQKGIKRAFVVIGDIINTFIASAVIAAILFMATYLVGLYFKTPNTGYEFNALWFLEQVIYVVITVSVINCGVYMLYTLTGSNGSAYSLAFVGYWLLPAICSNFLEFDNLFGKICRTLFNLAPMTHQGQAMDRIYDWKWIIVTLILNLVIFNAISIIVKQRKRY